MNEARGKLVTFLIDNGMMILAAIGLFVSLFIPFFGIVITSLALAGAIALFLRYKKGKGDIVFIGVALVIEITIFVSNMILIMRELA
ncbi:MAG: hypothetical protein WC344_00765 [Bacilli bacterium]|jgi:phage-related minor tail protein